MKSIQFGLVFDESDWIYIRQFMIKCHLLCGDGKIDIIKPVYRVALFMHRQRFVDQTAKIVIHPVFPPVNL